MGSIIFVHGTGVREQTFTPSLAQLKQKLEALKKLHPSLSTWNLVGCPWGDSLGVKLHLQGKSLPDYQGAATKQQRDDVMDWWLLYQDPELELRVWEAVEKPPLLVAPGATPKWKAYHQKIIDFKPSDDLAKLMTEADMLDEWQKARVELMKAGSAYDYAIQTISTEQDFQVIVRLIARSWLAFATSLTQAAGKAIPTIKLRDQIINEMVQQLSIPIAGLRTWVASAANKAAIAWHNSAEFVKANIGLTLTYTGVVSRDTLSDHSFQAAGDILFYQARGQKIREFIKATIAEAEKPIVLLSHSLGGIACVELLIEEKLSDVKGIITAGSQSPMFYEMDCLAKLEAGQPLPGYFPPWLNIYDLCDMLSYPAAGVFPQVEDKKLNSGLPYLQAHGAYWAEPEVWQAIIEFILKLKV